MSSTFGGYSIAVSGMSVNQSALTVTSHNLSNINTTGYSRQRITSQENTLNQQGATSLGSGTSVQEIVRARNRMLDSTYRQQNSGSGYWEAKSANIEDVQTILNEFSADDGTSTNGLQQTVEDFFSSWEELAKDPSSLSNRQSVIEYAKSLVDTVSQLDSQLQQLQLDAADKVKDGIGQLNTLAKKVADLNTQIKKAEVSGGEANDLRDQRDALLDSMSSLANVTVNEREDGTVEVSLGGVDLVQDGKTHTLVASGDGSIENPLGIQWSELGEKAKITSGSVAAYLGDADQSGVQAIDSTAIPYNYSAGSNSSITNLRQGLNDLITTIATQVNAIHSANRGLDDTTGLDFFLPVDDSQPLSSSNIQVNPALVEDTNKIAASANGESGDNTAATAIAELADEAEFQIDGLSMDCNSFYQGLISWLATTGDTANSNYETQNSLVSQVDNQRMSTSSVSLDEEMSNMITFQNAYSASARVLSTIDSLVEGLIEELG